MKIYHVGLKGGYLDSFLDKATADDVKDLLLKSYPADRVQVLEEEISDCLAEILTRGYND